MKIKSFQGGYDKNLSYLVWCNNTKISAIIDPAVNPTNIIETIEAYDLKLQKIFITHTHYDHYKYLNDYLFYFPNIEICCHQDSVDLFKNHNIRKLVNNEVISLGEILLISIYTPGHYYDSICYWDKKAKTLFTGDTMFVGRTGRTISKKSNINDLYYSIYSIILKLPHDTLIYPGHNYGYKKIISLKKNILMSKFFQCKSINDFKKVMQNFESNFDQN
tara:strand:- start:154 stop:810 length:657 start_codon:yes stop_codon:yes gene_type:complete